MATHVSSLAWRIVALQAPLSMGFPRQEYCSGLPFSSPGDLSDPGIEPSLHWQVDFFFPLPLRHQGPKKLRNWLLHIRINRVTKRIGNSLGNELYPYDTTHQPKSPILKALLFGRE